MSETRSRTRLPAAALRWTCDTGPTGAGEPRALALPDAAAFGQAPALRALRLGLELTGPGYNVFVAGLTGTGRTMTVKRLLETLSPRCAVPQDRLYVHNFADPNAPRLISLPAGRGADLTRELGEFADLVRRQLPRLFEQKHFRERREELAQRYRERERTLLQEFGDRLLADGFTLVQVHEGQAQRPVVVAIRDGKPASPEMIRQEIEGGSLAEAEGEALLERFQAYRQELREVLRRVRRNQRRMVKELRELFRDSAMVLLEGHLADLRGEFDEEAAVQAHLDAIEADLKENVAVLPARLPAAGEEEEEEWREGLEEALARYTVNLLTDRSSLQGCPVVVENFPNWTNLFGGIERVPVGPNLFAADHRHLAAGSLLRADGGYLLLSARDVLADDEVWEYLKRTLKSGLLEIQAQPSPLGPLSLKPEPIPIRVKVIMVGNPGAYDALYNLDPDFRKIFKVKADFAATMPRSDESIRHVLGVVAGVREREGLRPVHEEAAAMCAEFAVRLAGRRNRVTTRFHELADLVREADYWAAKEYSETIMARHVRQALAERSIRHGLLGEEIQRLMTEDVLMIATAGERVGQVNGLSVLHLGYHAFGKPTRITAATSAGGLGIINVEREARLSGGIYDKGVLIIAGWVRRVFAQDRPLSLTASLCFEQSYSGVDGDSASVAEICALLSELGGIPIRQGLAITGSINQHGEIQPVGGVNEKIEGFFDLCARRELTGEQGCVIPARNVEDLMLRPDLVDAAAAGLFAIHAVEHVEEAVEILTGLPAGARVGDGRFPAGTVYAAVEERLERYARAAGRGAGEVGTHLVAFGPGPEAEPDSRFPPAGAGGELDEE